MAQFSVESFSNLVLNPFIQQILLGNYDVQVNMPYFSGYNIHSSKNILNHFTNFTVPLTGDIQCLRTRPVNHLEIKILLKIMLSK